jgi:hypothetical protein
MTQKITHYYLLWVAFHPCPDWDISKNYLNK